MWHVLSSLRTILAGHVRRFRQICEHTQSVVSVFRRGAGTASVAAAPSALPPPSPAHHPAVSAAVAAASGANAPASPRAGRRASSRTAAAAPGREMMSNRQAYRAS